MLQMAFQAPTSVTPMPQTVWIVAQTNLNDGTQTGQLTLLGYATQADVGVSQPIGLMSYPITPALYQQYYTGAVDHVANGYALAQADMSVVLTPAVLDKNGVITTPAIMGSFFANASVLNVAIPPSPAG